MHQANDNRDAFGVSRRKILRGLAGSGVAVVGGTVLTGGAAGSPRINFAYVSKDVVVGDRVTLDELQGRPNLNCNDAGANIRTSGWSVSGDHDATWYFIPNGYKGGETVEVTGEAITCEDSDLADKEVQVERVEGED